MSDNETARTRNSVQVDGHEKTPDDTPILELIRDGSGNILLSSGTTVPNAEAGYAKGALFIKTDAADGTKALYENQGTTADCDFNLVGEISSAEVAALAITTAKIANDAVTVDKIAGSLIKYADVEVTAAQLKALIATPVELVAAAAAGAGYAIIPMAVGLRFDAGSEALTESADNLAIKYSGGAELMDIEATGFVDQTTNQNRYQGMAVTVMTPAANTALVLANKGDGEFGGNASDDAKLYVRTFYRIMPAL